MMLVCVCRHWEYLGTCMPRVCVWQRREGVGGGDKSWTLVQGQCTGVDVDGCNPVRALGNLCVVVVTVLNNRVHTQGSIS